jgi:hypothetical protein
VRCRPPMSRRPSAEQAAFQRRHGPCRDLPQQPAPSCRLPNMTACALEEAARVVGKGGSVVVVEPLSEGTFYEALRLIEDETEVRQAAQQAIRRALTARPPERVLVCIEYDRVEAFHGCLGLRRACAVATDTTRQHRASEALQGRLLARFETLSERNVRGYLLAPAPAPAPPQGAGRPAPRRPSRSHTDDVPDRAPLVQRVEALIDAVEPAGAGQSLSTGSLPRR